MFSLVSYNGFGVVSKTLFSSTHKIIDKLIIVLLLRQDKINCPYQLEIIEAQS